MRSNLSLYINCLSLLVWNSRRIFGLIIWFGKSNILRDITLDVLDVFYISESLLLPSNVAGQVYTATCFCALSSKVLPVLFIVRRILLYPGLIWLWHKRHRICLCLAIKSQCVSPGVPCCILLGPLLCQLSPMYLYIYMLFLKARCKILNNDPIIFMGFLKVHMRIKSSSLSGHSTIPGDWGVNAFTETM